MSAPRQDHRRALGLLLLANVFFGLSFPLMKCLMDIEARLWPSGPGSLYVLMTLAPRFVFGAALLTLFCVRAQPFLTRREALQGFWVGLFAAAGLILQNDGLRFTAASTSAFLTQFYAISIPVALALRHRRLPGWSVWVACGLVLAGVAILGHFNWRSFRLGRGECETLLSSLFFMGQILAVDRAGFRGNRTLPVTWMMFAVEASIFTAGAVLVLPAPGAWRSALASPPWLALTAMLTAGCTVLTYCIMNRWQPRLTATEAGLIYCFEPIFGSMLALCVPGWVSRWTGIAYADERLTAALLLGGGLITAANVLIQWRPPAPPTAGKKNHLT